ncbi:MAG TPA: glycosyltransferase [Candidatus Limnocylindrales bacterium]|nr:glycosyltransferase [Candidatus Limnocylindrales bacterium]
MATKILDVDLAYGPQDIQDLSPYRTALILLRWRGKPLGQVQMDILGGRITAVDLWRAASAKLDKALVVVALDELLPTSAEVPVFEEKLPSASVVICTRNRTDDLRRCLDTLCTVATKDTEIIVVDNAPSDDSTTRLVTGYPVHYVLEPRKGLNWARTRGAQVAKGEVVIYTDDDVVVEAGWIKAMLRPFVDPQVAAVTGLVMPFELETEAQELFEQYGGFGRGFRRREFTAQTILPAAAANVGAGANMAFRRQLLNQLGLFAVELDGGTATQSSGDTYAFYRLLRAGYRIVYDPAAVVWHRHRRSYGELRKALYGYSVGTYAFLLRCLFQHRDLQALQVAWYWFHHHHLRHLRLGVLRHPDAYPLTMTLAELWGCFIAPYAYFISRRRERRTRLIGVKTPQT